MPVRMRVRRSLVGSFLARVPGGDLGPAVDTQLVHDVQYMVVDTCLLDLWAEPVPDLPVGQALRNQRCHLHLAWSEFAARGRRAPAPGLVDGGRRKRGRSGPGPEHARTHS